MLSTVLIRQSNSHAKESRDTDPNPNLYLLIGSVRVVSVHNQTAFTLLADMLLGEYVDQEGVTLPNLQPLHTHR